ncbi:hypothetical protein Vretimale_7669 [Volvox reticuliferus]|uniref:Uncharacterized protein n=1 Tax=Volvox reticuliferus TaxID=1737510 RepID=A0A8J4CFF2_9CHLO|nr:hypothetical protein Vretifemale_7751 [Volvox reticuliferus]GIM02831.1 hypothetical protein Vretimale_7669 [Volvox reticuliferus]
MGCNGSKQGVVPVYDELHAPGNGSEPVAPRADGSGPGGKSVRNLGGSPSKRHVDRKDNQSFFDKSRSAKGYSTKGAKSQKRVAAFASRKATRLDAVEQQCKAPSSPGGKSRFARSIMAVTDAMFGPPPEWILRQTTPIKSQYQFHGVVGRGQFGQVYCIRHVKQNQKFACKTLGKKKLLSQLDADDIKREIEVMHHLSGHSLVVSLHHVFEDEKNVHLVMDLCQGDLYELLRECKYLSEEKAAPLMMLAIRAVQYCHAMGVVHRDIKPENFLLVARNNLSHVKLTDFGLSTFYQEGQIFNELLGSPYYIAPEVIRQKYGKEADVWSCGVMLYIMLCGEAPFFGEGDEGIFKSIMKAKLDFSFEPWPRLSRDVKMLLRRMLVKDPRERATLEEILAHPWFLRYAPQNDLFKTANGCGPSCAGGGAEHPLFSRIKHYSMASRTKKAALRYIVASMPDEVTAGLYNLFQDFDQDENHAIDSHEFREGFMRRGVVLPAEEATSLIRSADLDGDGVLNLVEWLGATIHIPEEQVELLVSEAFAFMDTNRDGYLTCVELVGYLGEGHTRLAELIIAEADTDMDGRVSVAEFRTAYFMTMNQASQAVASAAGPRGLGPERAAGGVDSATCHQARKDGSVRGPVTAVAVGEAGGNRCTGGGGGSGGGDYGGGSGLSTGGNGVVRMTSVTSVVSMGDDLTRNSSVARSES